MFSVTDAEKEIGRLTLALAEAEKRAGRDYLRFVEADREEIDRLREENERLREALKPFVEWCGNMEAEYPDLDDSNCISWNIRMRDIRRAASMFSNS